MKTTILAALLVLSACSSVDAPACDDATSVTVTPDGSLAPSEVRCMWNCTTRDGHPVALAWETYELRDDGYVLTGSETLAGFCDQTE
jgi:hypothetical protein